MQLQILLAFFLSGTAVFAKPAAIGVGWGCVDTSCPGAAYRGLPCCDSTAKADGLVSLAVLCRVCGENVISKDKNYKRARIYMKADHVFL